MADDENLFPELTPLPPPPEKAPGLSAGRRRTLRQKADIERGIHPLTRDKIHPDEARKCGNCRFREGGSGSNHNWPKCCWRPGETGRYPFITSSEASDCRAWWPACKRHEYAATVEQLAKPPRRAKARSTDPETSHEAADKLGDVRASQAEVLGYFTDAGPMHHEALVVYAKVHGSKQTEQGLRSRCSELVGKGLMEFSGEFTLSEREGRTRIWRVARRDG